jgi:hypothetical protein
MSMIQMIYASHPFGFDDAMLAGILLDARRCNERDGITGALICREDLYLQLLEGPEQAVEATYVRILRDDRHANINRLVRRDITQDDRLFPRWSMLDDPAQSWIWTRAQVKRGAIDDASEAEVIGLFERLSALTGR